MALRKTPVVGNDSKAVIDFTDKKYDPNSVVRIQALIRKHQAKKKYQIKPLQKPTQYEPMLVTNEPLVSAYRHPKHKPGSTVLVGTSFLYSVILACELSDPATSKPAKLFLIDSSEKMIRLWKRMKKEIQPDLKRRELLTEDDFFKNLSAIHYGEKDQYKKYMIDLFKNIVKKYGYAKVLQVMLHASVIQQDWADPKTFQTLKNIIDRLGYVNVYAYASNIIAFQNKTKENESILSHIRLLNPLRAFHADLGINGFPENFYLFDHHDSKTVLEKIGANQKLNIKIAGPVLTIVFMVMLLGAMGKLRPSQFLQLLSSLLIIGTMMMRSFFHQGSGSPTLSRDAFFKLPVGNSSDQNVAVVERKITPGFKDKQC